MKVSLKWLKDYVDVPADLEAFTDRLDLTGTAVDGVEKLGANFENIVTGQIVVKERHPDSDHLWVTRVDVGKWNPGENGQPELLQIVCGAQNFEQGDHVVVALVGAVLPGDFKIKKSKLRGVTSCGMNCSQRELGLGQDHEGIMVLPEDAPIGVPFAEYRGLGDVVLDLEITPNRPDCLSMVGVAREVGAVYRREVRYPDVNLQEATNKTADHVTVSIEDPLRCPRYTARIIRGVKVGPSPDWLVERITAAGARSINNVVDATNYLMFETGQPFHAFDFDKLDVEDAEEERTKASGQVAEPNESDKLGKATIIVRAAEEGERFTTLDGEERILTSDMTVIATSERAVVLAGVMGGLTSEVSETTTTVLLEAATFSPAHTSRTSRNLGLISESSMRYERGVDDNAIAANADRCAALIARVAGGKAEAFAEVDEGISSETGETGAESGRTAQVEVYRGLVDQWPQRSQPRVLQFRVGRFCAMMGVSVPQEEIVGILERIGCDVSRETLVGTDTKTDTKTDIKAGSETLTVSTPTFRPDLEREIDLYEEVLRLYGMEKVPSTLPGGRERIGYRTHAEKRIATIHATLRACGINETITYSLAEPSEAGTFVLAATEEASDGTPNKIPGESVELVNPLNAEQSVMRQSIVPGLLKSVAYNYSRGVKNIQLYELGTVFFGRVGAAQPAEEQKVAVVLSGAMQSSSWNVAPVAFDFFDGKGIVESLVRELAVPKLHFKELDPAEAPFLQPGRAATVFSGKVVLGWLGEVHPQVTRAYEIDSAVVAFELDLAALIGASKSARPYVEIPVFPAIQMDAAFVVDEQVSHEKMSRCMNSAGAKLLESVELFDIYRDEEKLGAGKKSMAYSFTYRANDRTLTSEEIEKLHGKVLEKVRKATKAEIRS